MKHCDLIYFCLWVHGLRLVLLLLINIAMLGVYFIEQPSSSIIMLHERMVWLQDLLEKLSIKEPRKNTKLFVCVVCDTGVNCCVPNPLFAMLYFSVLAQLN